MEGPSLWEPLWAGGTRCLGLEKQLGEWQGMGSPAPIAEEQKAWSFAFVLSSVNFRECEKRTVFFWSLPMMLKLHQKGAGGGLSNLGRVLPSIVKGVFSQLLIFPRLGLKKEQSFTHAFVGYNFLTSRSLKIRMSQTSLLPSNEDKAKKKP